MIIQMTPGLLYRNQRRHAGRFRFYRYPQSNHPVAEKWNAMKNPAPGASATGTENPGKSVKLKPGTRCGNERTGRWAGLFPWQFTGSCYSGWCPRLRAPFPGSRDPPPSKAKKGEGKGGEVKGGDFNLRLLIFPTLLTLFRHFLTLLFEEMPVSASGWEKSALSRPGK
jgi:hypothetical protein